VLRAIAGHLEPMEGDVRLGDRALTGPPEARFPQLAYVAQDAARHMLTESVRDEVEYGLRWTGTPAPSARRRAAGIARELGITELGERHPRDLSVGQRQLVALAGALALEPAVLVLDEPTRGLDPGRQALLVAALTRRARRGTTVVLASHDRAFAAAVADARIALRAAVTDRETAPK
jgi:energy-coupling factor transporter ATP-binding protein EcfA2